MIVTISILPNASEGTAVVNGDNTITFTPALTYSGASVFEYTVSDVHGDSDVGTVTITVLADGVTNHIPIATDDAEGTEYETAVLVDVLTNDTGLEDGGIILNLITLPKSSKGTILINGDNTIMFTPFSGYSGVFDFEYTVTDTDGDCDTANVRITVKEEGVTNYVPVAVDDKFYTNVNTTKILDILSNDTGFEDGGISLEIVTDIVVGQITVNDDNTVTYIPQTGYEGSDSFSYMVSDVDGDYDIATVTIEIMSGTLPGVNISPVSGNTSEDGTSATFTVVLNTQPTADVSIDLISNDLTEGTISDNRLTFTPTNWDTNQTITITGVNDYVDDGDITYKILINNAVSTDLVYNGLSISNVDVINVDDDEAGITVISDTNQTSEDGTSTSIKFVLNSQPLADVSTELELDDISEGSLDIFVVLFTPDNWSDTSVVVVTGVDDDEVDGDITYDLSISSTVSTDDKYDGLESNDISIVNIDNDSKELIIPEAFSPGNDGYNDYFHIVNLEHNNKASIRIYNRWGSLVYSDDNYNNKWDGRANVGSGSVGSKLPTGTYYYVLEINGKSKKINGSVFIKR